MSKNRFIGTWELISCELKNSNGEVNFPMGEDAIGYIIYNQDGYMSVAFMSANRHPFESGDILGGSIEEKESAIDTYVSYCGKYDVSEGYVTHHIEVSLFPNWIGTGQKRKYQFEENRLILSTDPLIVKGQEVEGLLIWKRA
jgi:hypothetical protein